MTPTDTVEALIEPGSGSRPDDEPGGLLRLETGSLFARLGLTNADVVLIAVVGAYCIAFAPIFLAPQWTPRMALTLAVLPAGLVSLTVRCLRRETTALVAAAALLWTALSALLATDASITMKGAIGRESSVVIVAAAIGMWSLGSELTETGRRWLVEVLLAMFAINALIATLQSIVRPALGALVLDAGRAAGLTTHPVYLGALMAAGCAIVCRSWPARPTWVNGALLALFGCGISVSGSRVALVSAAAFILFLSVRAGWRRVGFAAVLVGIGVTLGTLIANRAANAVDASSGGTPVLVGESAVDRLASSGGGLGHRVELWGYGLRAAIDHPVFGSGVGNFRSAVQSRYTAEFTQLHARNDSAPWFDAHNIVVELLVAVGVPGLLLFAAFGVLLAMGARGPLAVGAAAVALTWSLQPASLTTLPIVLFMLGAAAASDPVFRGDGLNMARTAGVAASIGALLAGALVVADLRLDAAVESGDPDRIEQASRWFWRDPVASDLTAQAWSIEALQDDALSSRALEWSERTIEHESLRPGWWENQARRQSWFDQGDEAVASLERALELQPWRISTWQGMLQLAALTDDDDLENRARAALCELGESNCIVDP